VNIAGFVAANRLRGDTDIKQHGYQISNLTGGWDTYEPAGGKQSNFDEWQGDHPGAEADQAKVNSFV